MKKLCICALVLIGLIPAALCAQVPAPVVLKAARLFDGKSSTKVQNGGVVIEGAKITAAGAGLPVPPGARVIDLRDATLLPGLIDTHVHPASERPEKVEPHIGAKDQVDRLRRTVAESAIRATLYARRTVEAGFTTVRNVGAAVTSRVARSVGSSRRNINPQGEEQ